MFRVAFATALTLTLTSCAANSPETAETTSISPTVAKPRAIPSMEALTGFSDAQITDEVNKLCPQALETAGGYSEEYLAGRLSSLEALSSPEDIVEFLSKNEWVAEVAKDNTQAEFASLVSGTLNSWIYANEANLTVSSGVDFNIGKARATIQLSRSIVEQCEISTLLELSETLEDNAKVLTQAASNYLDEQKELELEAAEAERKAAQAAAKEAREAEDRAKKAAYNALFLPSAPRHPDLKVEYFSCAGLGWGDTAARMKVRNTSDSEIIAYAMVVWLNARGEVLGTAGAEAPTFPGLVSNLDVPLPSSIRAYSDCKIAELLMFGEY